MNRREYERYFKKFARQIAFTGHRDIATEDREDIQNGLRSLAHSLDYGHPIVMHNGGAKGFDTLAYSHFWPHELVVTVPHIPFGYQHDELLKYLGVDIDFWWVDQRLCDHCWTDLQKPLTKADNRFYQIRNEHMVDQANEVICYWNGVEKGGTWNTIKYARKVGKPVRDIREL